MYDGTKSYNSTFRDTRSQSVSGQMVALSDLVPSTDYRVTVTAINTAGYENSSDTVVGTTLTGKLQSTLLPLPSTLHLSTLIPSIPPNLYSPATPPSPQLLLTCAVSVLLSL